MWQVDCEDRPYFYNPHQGICEQPGEECSDCILEGEEILANLIDFTLSENEWEDQQ